MIKFPNINDFQTKATLGEGGFGKVELVQCKNKKKLYARKTCKKHSTDVELESLIMNEGKENCIVRLFFTLADNNNVYLFMEACVGGDLWKGLHANGRFSEANTRFYVACAIKAIEVFL